MLSLSTGIQFVRIVSFCIASVILKIGVTVGFMLAPGVVLEIVPPFIWTRFKIQTFEKPIFPLKLFQMEPNVARF